jgi:hypothetical protein
MSALSKDETPVMAAVLTLTITLFTVEEFRMLPLSLIQGNNVDIILKYLILKCSRMIQLIHKIDLGSNQLTQNL